MAENVWRRRAPLWLRVVAGILVLPLLGIAVIFAAGALGLDTPLVWIFAIAAALAWLIVRRAPTPIAAALLVLGPLGSALVLYQVQRTFEHISGHLDQAPVQQAGPPYPPEPQVEPPPPDTPAPAGEAPDFPDEEPRLQAPSGDGHHYEIPADEAPGPDLGAPSGGGGSAAKPTLPEFPWPPPAASASYVLPGRLLESYRTFGDVTEAILAALEQNGYVERSLTICGFWLGLRYEAHKRKFR
jgi:hypothetical protein